MRPEDREIRFSPRRVPGLKGRCRDQGLLGHELGGYAHGLVVVPGGHADQGSLVALRVAAIQLRLQVAEQLANFRRSGLLVRELAQSGQVMAAGFTATCGHVGLLVPAQQAHRGTEVGDLADDLLQLIQFLAHAFPLPWKGGIRVVRRSSSATARPEGLPGPRGRCRLQPATAPRRSALRCAEWQSRADG